MTELAGKVERHRRDLVFATTYAEHAAIQSINVYLLDALAARKQVDLYVDWLQRLAGRRQAEISAGTWPAPVEVHAGTTITPEQCGEPSTGLVRPWHCTKPARHYGERHTAELTGIGSFTWGYLAESTADGGA